MHAYTLGADGCFRRDGALFAAIGADYRPASCLDDQDMWARWPGEEIRADLAQIAALGLNAVRVNPPASENFRIHATEFVRLGVEAGLAILMAGSDAFICDGGLPGGAMGNVFFSARPGSLFLGHDGLLDPFFHDFLPFAVSWARLREPSVVAALGFDEPAGARQCDACLRAILPAARNAGAAGFFWRRWRDVGPFCDGLLDAAGRLKAGHEFYCEYGQSLGGSAPPTLSAETVGLYAGRAGASPVATPRRLQLARYLQGCVGRATFLVQGMPPSGGCRQMLIPGVAAGAADAADLLDWVQAGGELFWHGPELLPWSIGLETLLGARPVDWRSGRGISLHAFGERFTMAHFPNDVRAELEPCGARVLARDQQGLPVLLENRVGRGFVRYLLPIVEEAIVPVAAHPVARDRWAAWYRGMLGT